MAINCNTASYWPPIEQSDCNMTSSHNKYILTGVSIHRQAEYPPIFTGHIILPGVHNAKAECTTPHTGSRNQIKIDRGRLTAVAIAAVCQASSLLKYEVLVFSRNANCLRILSVAYTLAGLLILLANWLPCNPRMPIFFDSLAHVHSSPLRYCACTHSTAHAQNLVVQLTLFIPQLIQVQNGG